MYIAMYTQVYAQLCIQPLKKNETYKIPTTPLPIFKHSKRTEPNSHLTPH